jgi:hypothetical protein
MSCVAWPTIILWLYARGTADVAVSGRESQLLMDITMAQFFVLWLSLTHAARLGDSFLRAGSANYYRSPVETFPPETSVELMLRAIEAEAPAYCKGFDLWEPIRISKRAWLQVLLEYPQLQPSVTHLLTLECTQHASLELGVGRSINTHGAEEFSVPAVTVSIMVMLINSTTPAHVLQNRTLAFILLGIVLGLVPLIVRCILFQSLAFGPTWATVLVYIGCFIIEAMGCIICPWGT